MARHHHRARPKRKRKVGATHHRRRSRSRSMGAVKVHPKLMQALEFIGGAGLGAVGAAFGNQALKTAFPTAPAWVGGAVMAGAAGAAVVFTQQTPFMMGLEAGVGAMGLAFVANETVISLPGISGMPQMTPPAAAPGYISKTVNGYMRNIPPRTLGNFSGGGARTVNGLFTN